MSTQDSPAAVLDGLGNARGWMEDFYRTLHQQPELSHQERQTAAAVIQRLEGAGFQVTAGVGGTGVVGILRNGDGPTVLLRADMDALPVAEKTGLAYASSVTAMDEQGSPVPVMHACGHDVHVTTLLGAATLMAAARDRWTGVLIVLFQPAEEVGDGARGMLDDGLAAVVGDVDVALAQHVLPMPAGVVGTRTGAVLSAANSMRVTVHGRGAHGSMPQAAVDPVVLASMIVVRLQTIISRELAPTEPAVLTVGSIQSGTKSNVIGDHAVPRAERPHLRRSTPAARSSPQSGASSPLSARPRTVRPRPSSRCSTAFPPTINDAATTDESHGSIRRLLRRSPAGASAAECERGLQRPPQRAQRALHLLGNRRHATPPPTPPPSTRVGSHRTSPSTTPPSSPPCCNRLSTPARKRSWSRPWPTWPGTTDLDEQPAGGPSTCRRHPAFPASSTIVPGRHG